MNKNVLRKSSKMRKLIAEFDRRVAALPVGFIAEALPEVHSLPVRPSGASLASLKARKLPKKIGWPD